MKKLLITTTAIIGASMIAATAHAESNVSASGNYTSSIYLGGDDTKTDSMTFGGSTFDLSINASKTTDSGLALSASTSLDVTGVDDPTTGNETSAAIAAGFGTISFSNDGASAAGITEAGGLTQSWNGLGDGVITDLQGKKSIAGNAGGIVATGQSITYTSPNINGLTFGYTMAESGGDSETDVEKEGTSGVNNAGYTRPDLDSVGQTSYAGFGVKYSMAGAYVNIGSASQTTSYTVKGEDADTMIDHDYDTDTAMVSANGEYSQGWSGTAIGLGYSTGPFSVRYSSITRESDDEKAAGQTVKIDSKYKGAIASNNTNETQIGVSFNYGAGTVSYVSATEDAIKSGREAMTIQGFTVPADPSASDVEKAEDVTNTIIAVSHNLANGLTVGFEQHTADVEIDVSKAGYESASESIITIGLNF